MLSQENTLDWVKTFFANMAEGGDQIPRGAGTTSPSGKRQQSVPTLEGTIELVDRMQAHHARELDGIVASITKIRTDVTEEIARLAQQGKRYDQQFAPAHVQVKLVGDVHRTMRSICRAPELTQANLADFDQWAEEMIHTIRCCPHQRVPL